MQQLSKTLFLWLTRSARGAKILVMCENTGKCQFRTLSTVFHLHSPGLITTTITIALNKWITIRSEGGVKIQVRGYF